MRGDTGRPDISFRNVFIDASSREYFISVPKAKQIIEAGAVEIEKLLRESIDVGEKQLTKLKQIEIQLQTVTDEEISISEVENLE